jgi:hypothetical protein
MANYAPPTEDVPIFNGLYFTDIPLTSKTGDGRYLKLIAQGDEDMNGYDINGINQVDTNSVKFSDNTIQTTAFTGSVGLPTGSMITFAGNGTIPTGYLRCDGQGYFSTAYPDLYNVIGITYGGVLGQSFATPDMTDKFVKGSTTSTGSVSGVNDNLITQANIQAFTPAVPAGYAGGKLPVVFNSVGGISRWNYIKGQPTGDGSAQRYAPRTDDDSANGSNLVDALEIGTQAPLALDNTPTNYAMIYIIKT